ncbi:hypothetical protein [Novosphingobium sp.]|uniref:hypothetical protein n=1 Tax=Novosphingobium sp. TaxID=1874826 RepID=UPI003BABD53C
MKQRLLSYRPDRVNGALLPAGLALVLLAGAALQLALPQGATVPLASGVSRAPDRRLPAIADVAAPNLTGRSSLFSPLRVVGAGPFDASVVGARPVGPLGGTLVLGALRVGSAQALLLREGTGRVLRLAAGRSYRGWQLLRIEASGARFRKDGTIMRIGFGASAPAAGSALISSASENNSE